jgi:hypothetical protein
MGVQEKEVGVMKSSFRVYGTKLLEANCHGVGRLPYEA